MRVTANSVSPPGRSSHPVYLRLQACLLLVFGAVILLRRPEDWETIYLPAARNLLPGVYLYIDPGRFTYPPAAVLLPLAFLPLPDLLQRIAWTGLNLAAPAVERHRDARALLAAAMVLCVASLPVFGETIGYGLQQTGAITLAAFLLLVACVIALVVTPPSAR